MAALYNIMERIFTPNHRCYWLCTIDKDFRIYPFVMRAIFRVIHWKYRSRLVKQDEILGN